MPYSFVLLYFCSFLKDQPQAPSQWNDVMLVTSLLVPHVSSSLEETGCDSGLLVIPVPWYFGRCSSTQQDVGKYSPIE